MNNFWDVIAGQLVELRTAASADDVLRILAYDGCTGDGFFAGSGGDGTVMESLLEAGWSVTWCAASYYWVMRAPGGDEITYVEGDIFRGDVAIRD